jgi:hypothetical protein
VQRPGIDADFVEDSSRRRRSKIEVMRPGDDDPNGRMKSPPSALLDKPAVAQERYVKI